MVSAGIASSLMSRVDPRSLAGVGTLLAGVGPVRASPGCPTRLVDLANLGVHASYVSDLLPWIVVMSFGMGFVFVPLTLTAVHGVSEEDSGIGSGVLNAMQQIGGALGLATLSTVAVHATNDKVSEIFAAAKAAAGGVVPQDSAAVKAFQNDAVASRLRLRVHPRVHRRRGDDLDRRRLIVFLFMNVSHEEINDSSENAPAGVAV